MVMWSLGVTLLMAVAVAADGKYNFGYTECTHHPYKAVCLGDNIISLHQERRGLTVIPTLSRKETCVKLKDNKITKFPDNLENLATVMTLDLSGNQITSLPADMHVMSKLEILDLSRNKITTFKRGSRFHVSLRGLLLADNQMTTIEPGIEIPGLFVLDLSKNLFNEIPFDFCVSDQLIRVDFENNPLKHDVSQYIQTINRCRNFNKIPFCLFTSAKAMSCSCDSLAPVFISQPSFCLGSSLLAPHNVMQCSKDSSLTYKASLLYNINVDDVKSNCSYALQTRNAAAAHTGSHSFIQTSVFVAMIASVL